MQGKSLLLQRQIAKHDGSLGPQKLMWGGMSLRVTGHCAHSLKWYLEISHEDSSWAVPKTGQVGRWRKPWRWELGKRWRELRIENSPSDNYDLLSLQSGTYGAAGFETRNCLALWVCQLPERGEGRKNMPGEESQRWKAGVQ